ncbi:bifunctional 2-polyprenyl-6-hydroxyphenol methylase/3-demethylubiquinol 3-O-methyltransferase UbiG [Acidovorax sp. 100]|uniref:class I SAM-dependent methyltransferase n=1 Tax=Acidovorax sp. 100 TaxID=2135635 RepID=UPI001314CE88|nr:class I SAM-dependent methyltransferase [Acidovorax sp. 100]
MSDFERYHYAFDPEGDELAARLIRRLPQKGRVLELGPGPGVMTKVMIDKGYQLTVVEIDPDSAQIVRGLGAETIVADLEDLQWLEQLRGRRFDAVLACDVLEHLRHPERVLEALRQCLEPQGRLIVSVPNIAYGGVIAALVQGMFDYTPTGLLDHSHLRFFTRRSLERLLWRTGWSPNYWEPYAFPVEQSEFARAWGALTDVQRQSLVAGAADSEVYEWMTVACHAENGPAIALQDAQTLADKASEDLRALQTVYAQEHASLLEHQKAFAQAREIIVEQQREIDALRGPYGGSTMWIARVLHNPRNAMRRLWQAIRLRLGW